MTTKGGFFRMFYRYHQICLIGLVAFLAGATLAVAAPQPTATITSLNKDVYVSFQGETPVSALAGTLVRQGDSIRAYSEADVMLHLSDGSKLQIKENTNLRIIAMTKDPHRTLLLGPTTISVHNYSNVLRDVFLVDRFLHSNILSELNFIESQK